MTLSWNRNKNTENSAKITYQISASQKVNV